MPKRSKLPAMAPSGNPALSLLPKQLAARLDAHELRLDDHEDRLDVHDDRLDEIDQDIALLSDVAIRAAQRARLARIQLAKRRRSRAVGSRK